MTPSEQIVALETELKQREYEISMLKETAVAVTSELDLERLLSLIATRAHELIPCDTVLIPILNMACNEYTYRAGAGRHTEEILGESLPLDFGVCGWVWRHKKAWWMGVLDELDDDEKNKWEKEAGTLLMVPLIGREHFLGGIACINRRGGGDFRRRDKDLLELFAGQVAIAIENAMAMKRVEEARQAAEDYQRELQRVNKRLSAVNRELEYLSLYDNLTGLPNRSLFRDRLERELASAGTAGKPFAILFLDLDRFQDINDTLGHEAGDQLIKIVSERFITRIVRGDTLCRMGGDEFGVLLRGANQQDAQDFAMQLLNRLQEPVNLGEHRVVITASVGISLYPEHGSTTSTLLKYADVAMYAAKQDRSRVCVYQDGLDQYTSGRLALASELRTALEQQDFLLYYQPKIDLASNTIVGVEALARWPHKDKGFIPPDTFISAMEQTGLIYPFSYWVLETALQQCLRWQQRGWKLRVAVNMPIMVLTDPRFLDELQLLLRTYPAMDCLMIEVTESVFLSDYDHLVRLMSQIDRLGVGFSIDDFGTGHSSLSRLKKLPVRELKIDRTFVMDMERSKDDHVIVKSTIDMARSLGLEVVAEGVETDKQLAMLRDMQCDMAQGYYVSKPLPAADFETFAEKSDWAL